MCLGMLEFAYCLSSLVKFECLLKCFQRVFQMQSQQDKRRRYSRMRSKASASSVFYHSQEEDPWRPGADRLGPQRDPQSGPLYDTYQDSVSESSPVTTEPDPLGKN